ncbi:rifin [Plasmodium reichenowi]|uniref:Rifin n=1 Tax=Plasmodium reichenowi TaxID=5854 RepID=A0A060RQD5_PLARE|nr:rifin [Plasmodium reichenowi]
MKVHYIKLLLLALPLNILVYNQGNHKRTTHYTPKIPTTRSLCECELYMPNYDNDPQMKEVMENFDRQTSQRFHEYDDRMKTTRQKCKEQCDKEIQKIILKDRLEKQMAQQLTTLETKIDTDDIPTCICEKSVADKVEKGCLRCGGVLGGGIAPSVGILGGIGQVALTAWKVAALKAAGRYAMKEGLAFGKIASEAAGRNAVIGSLKKYFLIEELDGIPLKSFFRLTPYNDVTKFANTIIEQLNRNCGLSSTGSNEGLRTLICTNVQKGQEGVSIVQNAVSRALNGLVEKATGTANHAAKTTTKGVADIITRQQTSEIASTYMSNQIANIAPIIAIVVIVLIMVIIYLILRRRRKKKMKKKLQYIKLLEE